MQGARTVRRVPLWYIARFAYPTVFARPWHFAPCCALLRLDTPGTPDTPDTPALPGTPGARCVALTVLCGCCAVASSVVPLPGSGASFVCFSSRRYTEQNTIKQNSGPCVLKVVVRFILHLGSCKLLQVSLEALRTVFSESMFALFGTLWFHFKFWKRS